MRYTFRAYYNIQLGKSIPEINLQHICTVDIWMKPGTFSATPRACKEKKSEFKWHCSSESHVLTASVT